MSEEKKQRGGERLAAKDKRPSARKAKKPDGRTKKETFRRRALTALTIVAAVIVVLFIAYKILVVKPGVEDPTEPGTPGSTLGADSNPHAASGRKQDFFTFLVVGRDTGGGGNTDTILLVAYDVKDQKMSVMSIPRDTMINVSWDIKRINSVYPIHGRGEEGIKALDEEIAQLVGFKPDFQVVVEWKAVGELVEALGGVTYDVPRNMDYEDPTQNLSIHVKKGVQKLNGKQAMGVVRFREGKNGYANGDLGRIETQQSFLKAVLKQCLQIQNMTRVGELAKVFTDNVTTNLSINNLAWFAQQAIFGGLKMENVNFVTMPCTGKSVWSRSYHQYQSYVVPNTDELVALVNQCFNPYKDELLKTDLDIMYVSKDGTIGSSSGKLEDQKANPAARNHGESKPATKPAESPAVSPTVSPAVSPTTSPGLSPQPSPGTSPAPTPEATPPVTEPAPPEGTPATPAPPEETPAVSAAPAPAATPTPAPPVETLPGGRPEGIPT